ncbi:hypothetical protein [Haloarcula marina]|uniref:hypothetical protein n=1 Tax=Haloarcula marina TaxID=2961574 RepID=UPI0020B84E69|nr:hypothetical protein [Halomicroarcula marina]
MSCPRAGASGEPSQSGAGSDAAVGRFPPHNWRPTVVHGALLWVVLAVAATLVPAGNPLEIGVAVVGVFTGPVLPVALSCDYLQSRRAGACAPGLRAYLANVARDVRTTLTRGDSLGSERRPFEC